MTERLNVIIERLLSVEVDKDYKKMTNGKLDKVNKSIVMMAIIYSSLLPAHDLLIMKSVEGRMARRIVTQQGTHK